MNLFGLSQYQFSKIGFLTMTMQTQSHLAAGLIPYP